MAYKLHNFQPENKLFARQLNEMDIQIKENTQHVAVQKDEPTNASTKVWIKSNNQEEPIALATMQDLENLKQQILEKIATNN